MNSVLKLAETTQKTWQAISISERVTFLKNLQHILLKNKEIYAHLITTEMHKPTKQAIAEMEKCALLCDYYLGKAELFLEPKKINTDNTESYVNYEPLGVILGVMPWNFPFWQVFRFAVPTLTAGNTVVVKHASNVPKCAAVIQTIFEEAGFLKGCYQNLPIPSNRIAEVIANPIIKAVSLTGSEQAGIAVATEAGKHLKKCVLELGGNNAFIILEDANLEKAIATAVNARMQNAGQSCIAAKRFLVHESIHDAFVSQFKAAVEIRLTGSSGQTQDVVLNHTFSGQEFVVPVAFTVIGVQFDPNRHIISRNSTTTLSNNSFELEESVFLYPNPSDDLVTIQMPTNITIEKVTFYNALGQNILTSANQSIRTNSIASGMYWVKIETSEGVIHKNFIKK